MFEHYLDSNPAPASATIAKTCLVLEETSLELLSSEFH